MRSHSQPRSAFTLIEMLVVTIIIGILISLVSVAVMSAITTSKVARLYFEAQQLTSAMQTMSLDSSTMPPTDLRMANATDFNAPIAKWFKRNYPRYDLATLKADLDAAGGASVTPSVTTTTTPDPGFALVFWLVGFDPDAERPLNGHAARMAGTDRKQWKYDFDIARLVNKRYLMPGAKVLFDDKNGNSLPDAGEKYRAYLYFDGTAYGTPFAGFSPYKTGTGANDYFFSPDSCQIICSGRDEILGSGAAPPGIKVPYAGFDADNVANFGEGGTMKDFIEKVNKL